MEWICGWMNMGFAREWRIVFGAGKIVGQEAHNKCFMANSMLGVEQQWMRWGIKRAKMIEWKWIEGGGGG